MADTQYDMSEKMRELFLKKEAQRKANKEFWRKQLHNPYLQKRPFDSVLFRYTALSAYSATHYKDSSKRKLGWLLTIAPIAILWVLVSNERDEREKLYRSGAVAYEDRPYKLLL